MVEKLKTLLIQMVSYLSIYEIAVLLGIFFVFIMIFTLGLLLRGRRFIASFFFFLSILVIFSAPIVLQFVMQRVLYPIDVGITSAHAMQYTKGFFVAGHITHKGKIAINECHIAVNEVRDDKNNKVLQVLNTIMPKSSSGTTISIDIGVGQSNDFAVIVPHFEAKEPFLYRIYVDCYFSNKFAQKMQKNNHKQDIDILKPQIPQPEVLPQAPKQEEQEKESEQEEHITEPIQDLSQETQERREEQNSQHNIADESSETSEDKNLNEEAQVQGA
ncbi:DUF2393 domain-containing protein [Helicobacter sp. MIT 21-1697]|uniref:DUF2393 domain-containing protein n=1 Tax=Helicobacter sp. MIT 21-1697 TaxID=2993733 RepID=UPI00224A74D5|nr:DUF2393 domain-containing protein [Helicobacter sp. MIT 21-1697]MCX2716403.1 DUF2393 domain-containing protein [Helicobacter sp. MIT 21-1697]